MHRSGTSLAARALDALGVSFGDTDLLMQPGPDNPVGYWENRLIKELDDDLLAHLGGSWDSPPVLARGWSNRDDLEEFRVRGAQILETSFSASNDAAAIGWKDPRLSLLLPFWRDLTQISTTIVIVRDPTEVAASLGKRDEIGLPQASLLWLRYLLAAIDDEQDHLVLDHRAFFTDLEQTLNAMADHLSLPRPTASVMDEITQYVDPSLRHHVAGNAPLADDNPLAALALEVWNGGAITVEGLRGTLYRAISEGWLRPPVDTDALDRARARNADLTGLLRRRTRQRIQAEPDLEPGDDDARERR